jgi:hypothetical protein
VLGPHPAGVDPVAIGEGPAGPPSTDPIVCGWLVPPGRCSAGDLHPGDAGRAVRADRLVAALLRPPQSSSRETAVSRASPAIEASQVDQPGRVRMASRALRAAARSPRREAASAAYRSRAPSGAKTARVS